MMMKKKSNSKTHKHMHHISVIECFYCSGVEAVFHPLVLTFYRISSEPVMYLLAQPLASHKCSIVSF